MNKNIQEHNSQPPYRLLVISYEYPPLGGGGAKVVDGLTRRLADSGYMVDVITMHFKGLARVEKSGNLTVYRVPGMRGNLTMCRPYEMVPYLIMATFKALSLTGKNRYAINHTHFIFPDSIVSALVKAIRGVPLVTTAHGSDVPGYNPNRFQLLHKLLRPVWGFLTNRIDCIVCPSEFLQNLIHENNPGAATVVIPNGIELNKFSPHAPKVQQILCVTRMFERKGVQYLIAAFKKLDPPDWKLILVGDGPYLDEVKAHADGYRAIQVLGFLENDSEQMRQLYENSSIFVLPSASENFPIVLLEAMTAGAAVVTTRGTGCENVAGTTALLVAPRSTRDLESALEKLMTDKELRERIAAEGRARVESLFSWQSVIDQHLNLYDVHLRREQE